MYHIIDYFRYRTSQEELRQYYKGPNATEVVASDNALNSSVPSSDSIKFQDTRQYGNESSLLSTETLINIHGGLMAALFTIALFR